MNENLFLNGHGDFCVGYVGYDEYLDIFTWCVGLCNKYITLRVEKNENVSICLAIFFFHISCFILKSNPTGKD